MKRVKKKKEREAGSFFSLAQRRQNFLSFFSFFSLRYEGVRSPYIYPMYGLGELPQAFARLAAVHGVSYSQFFVFLF